MVLGQRVPKYDLYFWPVIQAAKWRRDLGEGVKNRKVKI